VLAHHLLMIEYLARSVVYRAIVAAVAFLADLVRQVADYVADDPVRSLWIVVAFLVVCFVAERVRPIGQTVVFLATPAAVIRMAIHHQWAAILVTALAWMLLLTWFGIAAERREKKVARRDALQSVADVLARRRDQMSE
jgi:hypothetical protein